MVLGAKQALKLYQASLVYRYFHLVTDANEDVRRQGALLALEMRITKTRIYQAIALVLRQADALSTTYRQLENNDVESNALYGGHTPQCLRHRKPGQIPCPHDINSLTHRIAKTASDTETLVITPADVSVVALRKANMFFEPTITIRMGDFIYDYPGMRVVLKAEG